MKTLQLNRDITAKNDSYTGPEGELTIDISRWEIRLHDGVTPGGHRLLNLQQLIELFMSKDSEFGQVVFAENDRGVLTRIGDRQYALRLFKGIEGVLISTDATQATTNENGETADFYIGLDPTFVANLITTAGRIAWCGTTGGTADAFTVTTPEKWTDRDGAVLAFVFHTTANDNATLTVTIDGTGDAANTVLTPAPILTANNSALISHVATEDRVVVAMRVGDNFVLIGEAVARDVGIEPITGLEVSAGVLAKNVQEALAALQAEINAINGVSSSAGGYFKFGNPTSHLVFSSNSYKMPLKDGECRLILSSVRATVPTTGEGGTGNSSGSPASAALYIVSRFGDDVWLSLLRSTAATSINTAQVLGAESLGWAADNLYTRDNWIKTPWTGADADNISLGGIFNQNGSTVAAQNLTYGSVGVPTNPPS